MITEAEVRLYRETPDPSARTILVVSIPFSERSWCRTDIPPSAEPGGPNRSALTILRRASAVRLSLDLFMNVTAESSRGKDAKMAGGAAAAGAIIGAIAGGGKGALKGGAIGGAAGGAAILATRGKEVALEAGAPLDITLVEDVQVD